jgi:hypothetical protein
LKTKFKLSATLLAFVIVALLAWKFTFNDESALANWKQSNESSTVIIDHLVWQNVLDKFLFVADDPGVNLFDYQALIDGGREELSRYLEKMSNLTLTDYNRNEQFAYWVNLYNALTVDLIADHYPTESITQISGRPTSFGPWDNPAIDIQGETLSLNDIEHRILRPLWKDYRIHFALNCASIGCPNLQAQTFSAKNSDTLLNQAAQQFLNHPRAIEITDNGLVMSSIFDWYQEDFGANETELLGTLSPYLSEAQQQKAISSLDSIDYQYDWSLNDDS